MTNIYVGFHDQRNSSRVLKPPGGGTSNIFNNDFIPDVVPKTSPIRDGAKYKNSSIQDVLQTPVTCQLEEIKIVESSTKSEVTETDSSGDTKIVASESKMSFKKEASIGEILNQEEIMEKKKTRGSVGNQRVPPGGYSSGLW